MKVTKVKAPGHFAAFCVAINEPFYYLNNAFYLMQQRNAELARQFCADNGVRACDLAGMTFEEVTLDCRHIPMEVWPTFADSYNTEEGTEACRYDQTDLEKEALAAYRAELQETGSVGCSREAYIEDYINQHR